MNEHKKPRSNKAKNDKDSILADAKNLLAILYPAIQRMPKIERIEGAPTEMKRATLGIIRHFSIAKECQDERVSEIRKMIGMQISKKETKKAIKQNRIKVAELLNDYPSVFINRLNKL